MNGDGPHYPQQQAPYGAPPPAEGPAFPLKFPGWPELVGFACGLAPFVIALEHSTVHTVNGRVVEASYSNPPAMIGGVLAVVMGVVSLAMLTRTLSHQRALRIGAGIALLALGSFQFARGMGLLFSPQGSRASVTESSLDPFDQYRTPPAPDVEKILGSCRDEGNQADCAEARRLVNQLCESKQKLAACADATVMALDGEGGPKNEAAAATFAKIGCDGGNAQSCSNQGYFYVRGVGVDKDLERGRALFERACLDGSAMGCKNLGAALADGMLGPEDQAGARPWFQKACDLDSGEGCDRLGVLLDNGVGGPTDEAAARAAFDKSCRQDWKGGCLNLGRMLESGRGGAKDEPGARTAYGRGCELGQYQACNVFGIMALTGAGGETDAPAAMAAFERACDGDNSDGCFNLGHTYREGKVVDVDEQKARDYFDRACKAGDQEACALLK